MVSRCAEGDSVALLLHHQLGRGWPSCFCCWSSHFSSPLSSRPVTNQAPILLVGGKTTPKTRQNKADCFPNLNRNNRQTKRNILSRPMYNNNKQKHEKRRKNNNENNTTERHKTQKGKVGPTSRRGDAKKNAVQFRDQRRRGKETSKTKKNKWRERRNEEK